MRVLVTNAKNRIAYNIVRSLGSRGVDVYCADFVPRAMSAYSRYARGYFVYPSPFSAQEQFKSCLIHQIQELEIDVLIPVFEELYLIAQFKDELSQHVKIVVPDYAQILAAHNKDRWEPIATSLDVAVPATYQLSTLVESPDLQKKLPYPVLIKPKQGGGGYGITRIEDQAGFERYIDQGGFDQLPWERFIVQQFIEGETLCVAMMFNQGAIRGKTTYRQLREYPPFGGQATCRVSLSHPQAERNLERLLEAMEWHGVCQADFLVETTTGQPFLIDINPRFWGSLAQGIASGVDFPNLMYEMAVHGDTPAQQGFEEGVMTQWLGGELRGFVSSFRRAPDKWKFIAGVLSDTFRSRIFDDFSLKDPLPFFVWCFDSVYRVIKYRGLQPHESLDGVWE